MIVRSFPILAILAFGGPAIASEPPDFGPVVERSVAQLVQNYGALVEAATAQEEATKTLCEDPSQTGLQRARSQFADLVGAWAAVEMVRFGPAREANRYERLFFWPDRRGRGLRQVQKILATEDPTARTAEALGGKSVAVQGLPALEFVLFGTGSDSLSTEGGFRCEYGGAIASRIATVSDEILAGWTKPDGYAAAMTDFGPDNPLYRSGGEAFQELLRAANEQIQIVRDLKIGAAIGDAPAEAKPKRAPLWRSNLTLPMIVSNMEAVETLLSEAALEGLLGSDDAWIARSVAFELRTAKSVVTELSGADPDWTVLVTDTKAHQRLAYTRIPLASVGMTLTEAMPGALGLILGFNSLDGD
ncbi:MAG: imelysin family protein [Pseudomonadota bacterium]